MLLAIPRYLKVETMQTSPISGPIETDRLPAAREDEYAMRQGGPRHVAFPCSISTCNQRAAPLLARPLGIPTKVPFSSGVPRAVFWITRGSGPRMSEESAFSQCIYPS